MRRFIESKLGKAVSNVVALALFIPYVTMLSAGRAEAQLIDLPSWAVLEFANTSGIGPNNLGTVAADSIRTELNKTGKYDPVPKESIDRAYVSLNLQPPVVQMVSLVRLGQELRASTIVTGEIVKWRIVKDGAGKRADVILKVAVMDVASGLTVNGTALTASSSVRPPETAEDIMLADALSTASNRAVSEISSKELPKATVLNTTGEVALINQGARSGFKAGQELIVLRGREQVAQASVTDVEPDSSYIKITKSKRGIQPGDKVRVIFTPPDVKAEWNSRGDISIRPGKRRSPNSGLFTVLAIVGLVAFVVISNPNGQSLASTIRAEATNEGANGLAAVEVSWSPDMFTKGFDRRVQWQLWRTGWTTSPVLVTPGNIIRVIDDGLARAFTYGDIPGNPPGGMTCDNSTMPETTIDAATPVPGVTNGIPYMYQVSLIYRLPGSELPSPTEDDWCYFTSGRTTTRGTATPYDAVTMVAPSSNATISGPVSFSFTAAGNLLSPGVLVEYIVQISPTALFAKNQTLTLSTFRRTDSAGTLVAGPFDLSGVFPTANEMYWRVGVRNIDDVPGPKPDRRTGERYVFNFGRRLVR